MFVRDAYHSALRSCEATQIHGTPHGPNLCILVEHSNKKMFPFFVFAHSVKCANVFRPHEILGFVFFGKKKQDIIKSLSRIHLVDPKKHTFLSHPMCQNKTPTSILHKKAAVDGRLSAEQPGIPSSILGPHSEPRKQTMK